MDTAAQILRKLLCQRYEFNSQYNDDTRYSADSKFNIAVSAFAAQIACAEGKSGESHIFDDSSFKAQLFTSESRLNANSVPAVRCIPSSSKPENSTRLSVMSVADPTNASAT